MRAAVALVLALIFLAINLSFVYDELKMDDRGMNRIPPTKKQLAHVAVEQDPLTDISYSAGVRESNLKSFGLPDDMVATTIEATRRLEEAHTERIRGMLSGAANPVDITDSLCGATQQVRPRYGALRLLVMDDKGRRVPINLRRVSTLEVQDWSRTSLTGAVYDVIELAAERKPDATLMGIAAIMASKEQDAIDRHAPWGRGGSSWAWKRAEDGTPGLKERLVDYFALMHLTLEIANEEGGVCGL